MRQQEFKNLEVQNNYGTRREDGQYCPVDVEFNEETGEIKTDQKSARFFAFNKENYKSKSLLSREEPVANSILEFFIQEMDSTNAICVSMATLEKLFNRERKTIAKHIKVLTDRNFVEIFKVGNMNAYAINAYLVFTQGDKNLYKAKFKATMYINYDEQTAKIKRQYAKQITTK